MTPPRDLDELASALIDGLLDGDEAAAAQGDPAVVRRAEQMLAARDAVRAVEPPAPGVRDDAIAAALRAADGALPGGRAALPDDPGAGAVPMDPGRSPDAERGGDVVGPAGVRAGAVGPGPATAGPFEASSVGADPMGPAGLDSAPPAAGAPGVGEAPSPPIEPVDPDRARGAPGGPPGGADDPRVVPMGAARPGRSAPSGRPARRWSDPRWLGAAAAVVLVLAVGGLLAIAGGSDSDDAETASMESADEPTTSAGGSPSAESAPGAGGDGSGGSGSEEGGSGSPAAPDQMSPNSDASTSGGGQVVDLGDADDREDLAGRVGIALDDTGARTQAPVAADDGDGEGSDESVLGPPAAALGACEDPLAGRTAGPLVMTGRGTLDGEAVTVWVHEDGDAHRMVAVDRSCSVVAEGVVPG